MNEGRKKRNKARKPKQVYRSAFVIGLNSKRPTGET